MDVAERMRLIKEVGEEIIGESELRELLESGKTIIAYDGFEPSGNIHIAQGLMRAITINKLTRAGIHMKIYIADWFAMLNGKYGGDMKKIRTVGEYFIEVWKACGVDTSNVEFIWTSEFIHTHPDYWDTFMKLSMNVSVKRVLRCGQIMGRKESDSNPASQIIYPLMQATDIYHLNADIAQLGMDQRKVNMLARDIFPKIGFRAPIAIHHHMLMGLTEPKTDVKGINAAIEKKMSKSNPASAIYMTDSPEEIKRKIKKAYCPEKNIVDNPILEYCKYIIFEKVDSFTISRPEKFGSDVTFTSYEDLASAFSKGNIHPLDLKNATADALILLLQPIQDYFEKNSRAHLLLEAVRSF